jgi:hypothetical protein
MATKTGILATINGFLTAIITQAKVRSASSTIVDEIYPTSVTDNDGIETYTTKSGTDIEYLIFIIKSGNIAHIRGQIRNTTNSFLTNQSIFTWKDNEFKPLSGIASNSYFFANNSSNAVRLRLSASGLEIFNNSLVPQQNFDFDFKTYITQP